MIPAQNFAHEAAELSAAADRVTADTAPQRVAELTMRIRNFLAELESARARTRSAILAEAKASDDEYRAVADMLATFDGAKRVNGGPLARLMAMARERQGSAAA